MNFYDQQQQPIEPPARLVVGSLFAIGVLDFRLDSSGAKPLVGLFVEDDGNYFLKSKFDAGWLADLVRVAESAQRAVLPESLTAEQRLRALEQQVLDLLVRTNSPDTAP